MTGPLIPDLFSHRALSRDRASVLCWFCGEPYRDAQYYGRQPLREVVCMRATALYLEYYEHAPAVVLSDNDVVYICGSCVERFWRQVERKRNSCKDWLAKLAHYERLMSEQAANLSIGMYPPEDLEQGLYFSLGCWFTGISSGAPQRLFLGLPLHRLFTLGFRFRDLYPYPDVLLRYSLLHHAADERDIADIPPETLAAFRQHVSAAFPCASRSTLDELARARPAIGEYAIAWYYGQLRALSNEGLHPDGAR